MDENEITVEVHPGAAITALIGDADGHFIIWHLPRNEDGKTACLRGKRSAHPSRPQT